LQQALPHGLAVGHGFHVEIESTQIRGERIADIRMIVDDENAGAYLHAHGSDENANCSRRWCVSGPGPARRVLQRNEKQLFSSVSAPGSPISRRRGG